MINDRCSRFKTLEIFFSAHGEGTNAAVGSKTTESEVSTNDILIVENIHKIRIIHHLVFSQIKRCDGSNVVHVVAVYYKVWMWS